MAVVPVHWFAKKTVKYGARQNYKRSTRVNESFTEMLMRYDEEGLKFVADTLVEEPTEEEFNAEIKKAQDKSEGKDKAEVAKASVQAVKNEEVEVIDADEINGVEEVTIDERHMSDAEMNKREKIVKSMKKGLSGFKQRYGDRAKNVMYATATKQAMKEESESEHYKAGHEHAVDHAMDSGFKVTARARKKEMLADNPHKPGTPEHKEWHRGALAGHQTGLDNM